MGLLGRFRQGRKAGDGQESLHQVKLESLKEWIDSQLGDSRKRAEEQAKSIMSAAEDALKKIKARLNELERHSFGGGDKTYATANMAKDSFVKHSYAVLHSMRMPSDTDFNSLKDLESRLSQALSQISSGSPKQLFLISTYFKDKGRELITALDQAGKRMAELSEFLKSDGKTLEAIERLGENAHRMSGMKKRALELGAEEEGIKAEIDKMDNTRREAAMALEGLVSGVEWKEMERISQSIARAEANIAALEDEANEALSPAKRPLKKLGHSMESGSQVPENPFREAILSGREQWLHSMIAEALKQAGTGGIRLKPSEMESLEQAMDFMQSRLPGIKEMHQAFASEADALKSQISRMRTAEKKQSVERDLMDIESGLKAQWAELDARMKEKKQAETSLQEIKAGCEKLVLEQFGKRLEIEI